MRRGETVDAETAFKIVNRPGMENHRAAIWPHRMYEQALKSIRHLDLKINLAEMPCQRNLVHLICEPEGIMSLIVRPHSIGTEPELAIAGTGFDYEGNHNGRFFISAFVETEAVARARNEEAKKQLLNIVAERMPEKLKTLESADQREVLGAYSLESLLKLKMKDVATPELNAGMMMLLAIALEKFAFSTYAATRLCLTRKQQTAKKWKEWPAIEIVSLRVPEKKKESEGEQWEYSCQFYVKGHWHKYHTKEGIILRFVDEYIKGPKDAPLKPKPTKIYKVIR